MNYYTKMHTDYKTQQITKEQAKHYLKGAYIETFVDDIIDKEKSFRLRTPYRDVWTMTKDGRTAMAGFFGVVGE